MSAEGKWENLFSEWESFIEAEKLREWRIEQFSCKLLASPIVNLQSDLLLYNGIISIQFKAWQWGINQ